MEKRVKMMYLIFIVIIVLSIVGYFVYNSYSTQNANSQFDKYLVEANSYYQDRLIKMNESTDALPAYIQPNNGHDANQISNVIKLNNESETLLDKEINSLNEAKKYANTDAKNTYINLLLDSRKDTKKYFETLDKLMDANLRFAEGKISLAEQNLLINTYSDDLSEIIKDKTKINKIKTFLVSNSEFRDQITILKLKTEYLGEINK